MQVAVCGPAQCSDAEARAAFEVGRQLARRGAIVLCGGGAGVMAAVAAGARSLDGTVVGIRPGFDPGPAATSLSVVVATNLGEARNAVIVASADAVIVIGGSWGTLSELALAMRRAQDLPPGAMPVVSLGGWQVLDAGGHPITGITVAADPEQAVAAALGPLDDVQPSR
jgi:uncharacterized protein (TIGR00725 family)